MRGGVNEMPIPQKIFSLEWHIINSTSQNYYYINFKNRRVNEVNKKKLKRFPFIHTLVGVLNTEMYELKHLRLLCKIITGEIPSYSKYLYNKYLMNSRLYIIEE